MSCSSWMICAMGGRWPYSCCFFSDQTSTQHNSQLAISSNVSL